MRFIFFSLFVLTLALMLNSQTTTTIQYVNITVTLPRYTPYVSNVTQTRIFGVFEPVLSIAVILSVLFTPVYVWIVVGIALTALSIYLNWSSFYTFLGLAMAGIGMLILRRS